MANIKVGKLETQTKNMRGWLVGQFMPEGDFKDTNLEIYYKTFLVGDTSDKLHFHPQGKEYMIVLGGKAKMRIGDDIVELEKGDYVAISNNTPDQIIEVMKELTVIGVRYPSIPDNKVFVK